MKLQILAASILLLPMGWAIAPPSAIATSINDQAEGETASPPVVKTAPHAKQTAQRDRQRQREAERRERQRERLIEQQERDRDQRDRDSRSDDWWGDPDDWQRSDNDNEPWWMNDDSPSNSRDQNDDREWERSREREDQWQEWERQQRERQQDSQHRWQEDQQRQRDQWQEFRRWQQDNWHSHYVAPTATDVQVELTSLSNDWVTVSIESVDGEQELSFTDTSPRQIYLAPGAYRLRFRPTLSSQTWQAGYLNLGRTNFLRIVFDQATDQVRVYDDPSAWSAD